MYEQEAAEPTHHLLVVDDDRLCRTTHRMMLSKHFSVSAAATGEEALALCAEQTPDLILLDVTMPGLDGYETCRRLREQHARIPIIFVTACQTLDEHLQAFEAGGDDIIVKPVEYEILLRKIRLALARSTEENQLRQEKDNLQSMAMDFLSSAGENGVLLNFTRGAIRCRSYEDLAKLLINAIGDFGLSCSVMIRYDGQTTIRTSLGQPSPLEVSILENSTSMGRIFQLGNQCVINHEHISLIARGLPPEEEKRGRLRDNLAILAETAEALCDNVHMRQRSGEQAEQLQLALGSAANALESLQKRQQGAHHDASVLLEQMVEQVEKAYSWLDTSPDQENAISTALNHTVTQIHHILNDTSQHDRADFEIVLATIRGTAADSSDFSLF